MVQTAGSKCERGTDAVEIRSGVKIGEVVDAENDLSTICRIWINLQNLVHEVARVSDTRQARLKISHLICPTGTGGQVQADKTCMQWLTNVAGSLACAPGFRPEIIRVSGDERPVIIDGRRHQLVIFPACHAPARHMCAFWVTGRDCHVNQGDGQAFVDQQLQKSSPRFTLRQSNRSFL